MPGATQATREDLSYRKANQARARMTHAAMRELLNGVSKYEENLLRRMRGWDYQEVQKVKELLLRDLATLDDPNQPQEVKDRILQTTGSSWK